jgi:enoyl-CoA hydratase
MAVRIEKNGKVWTVIHDRPDARNAMDPESADRLTAAFLEFDADKDAAVAVFYGAGGAFCAGWDLKYVSTLNAEYPLGELDIPPAKSRGNGGDIPRGPLGPSRLELDKPVIAAIEGPAVAGGMELGLWCDFRVMARPRAGDHPHRAQGARRGVPRDRPVRIPDAEGRRACEG